MNITTFTKESLYIIIDAVKIHYSQVKMIQTQIINNCKVKKLSILIGYIQ